MTTRLRHANSFSERPLRAPANALLLMLALGTGAALHAQSVAQSAKQPQAAGTYSLLYSFEASPDACSPQAGLVRDSSGNLYGTTFGGGQFGNGTVFKVTSGGTETVLHSFAGSPSDGSEPQFAILTLDAVGNLYGTTPSGGEFGYGTVFKVTATGTESVVYNFTGGSDGGYPYGGIGRDSAGNVYGTASIGGAYGYGVLFKVTPGGTESVLHSFSGSPADGASPKSGLTRDSSGNLYGTTASGGASGDGTVFKLTASGTESVLYSFKGGPLDGANPVGGDLLLDTFGNLDGVTEYGGAKGNGVVFALTPGGTESVPLSFNGAAVGGNPFGGVTRVGAFGILTGTAAAGGSGTDCPNGGNGCGVLFGLASNGAFAAHDFGLSSSGDGATPFGGLVKDPSYNVYGTLSAGGAYGCGAVFKYTPPGLDSATR